MKPRKEIRITIHTLPKTRFAVPVRHALTSHEFWRLLVELAVTQKRRRAGNLLNQLKVDRLPGQYGRNFFSVYPEVPSLVTKGSRSVKRQIRHGKLPNSQCSARRPRSQPMVQGRLALQTSIRTARRFRLK